MTEKGTNLECPEPGVTRALDRLRAVARDQAVENTQLVVQVATCRAAAGEDAIRIAGLEAERDQYRRAVEALTKERDEAVHVSMGAVAVMARARHQRDNARARADRAEAENARLLERLAGYREGAVENAAELQSHIVALRNDNARLRDLLRRGVACHEMDDYAAWVAEVEAALSRQTRRVLTAVPTKAGPITYKAYSVFGGGCRAHTRRTNTP